MGRKLIDADALKDWLEIVPLTGDGGVDINDLESWIAQQPTANAWIPCSERLPKVGQNVMFSVAGMYASEGCLKENGDWAQFRWSSTQSKNVVDAWAPMPEPWKGNE